MVAMWRAVSGTFLIVLSCLSTILLVFVPSMPLLVASYPLFKKITSIAGALWQSFSAYLLEHAWGMQYVFTGDKMQDESHILISNHRTRLDWALLWPLLARFDMLPYLHIVLKSDIKKYPIMGWGTQMLRYIFLSRKWEHDEAHLTTMLQLIGSERKYSLLLFPEGTDFNEKGRAASKAFAEKQNLPQYQFILHPRTTGFIHCLKQLRASSTTPLQAVYDVTMAFRGPIAQSEVALAAGNTPKQIFCHIQRVDVASLAEDSTALDAWVKQRFATKEKVLSLFYANDKMTLEQAFVQATGSRLETAGADAECLQNKAPILNYGTALIFVLVTLGCLSSLLITNPWWTIGYIVLCAVAFNIITKRGGIDGYEANKFLAASKRNS
jgi:lysocardiolipin and lysophospholipid acyltransferase